MPVSATTTPESAASTAARPMRSMRSQLQERMDREARWADVTRQLERKGVEEALSNRRELEE
jgi:hypothetical protein